MRLNFPKKARLRRAAEFRDVYSSGKRLSVFPLRLRALERPGAPRSRLGMAVGRKVGRAVLRNRWKRAIREAFRLHGAALPGAWDVVVAVAQQARPQDVERVEEAFLAAAEALAREAGRSPCGGGMSAGQATHGRPSEGGQV